MIDPTGIYAAMEAVNLPEGTAVDFLPSDVLNRLTEAVEAEIAAEQEEQAREVSALRTRLAAAENVCVMLAWGDPESDSPAEDAHRRATWMLWNGWRNLPGVTTDRDAYPHLTDRTIAGLAARDEHEQVVPV